MFDFDQLDKIDHSGDLESFRFDVVIVGWPDRYAEVYREDEEIQASTQHGIEKSFNNKEDADIYAKQWNDAR